jgi:hypothetical protein
MGARIADRAGALAKVAIELPARLSGGVDQIDNLLAGSPPRDALARQTSTVRLGVDETLRRGTAEVAAGLQQPDSGIRCREQSSAVVDRQLEHPPLVEVGRQRLGDLPQRALVLPLEIGRGVQPRRFERRGHLRGQERQDALLVRADNASFAIEPHDERTNGAIAHDQRYRFDGAELPLASPIDRKRPALIVVHDDRLAARDSLAGRAFAGLQRAILGQLAGIAAEDGHQQTAVLVAEIQRHRVAVEQVTGVLRDEL